MSARKIIALLFVMLMCVPAIASDIEVWQEPGFNFAGLKKIFVMPPNFDLKAGNQLMPQRQLRADFFTWVNEGIRSAFGKKSKFLVKDLASVVEDMKFIHGDNISPDSREFFRWANEMGYTAFITADVSQKFVTEHVPETTRTYTEYRTIEKKDHRGRVIEVSEPRLYRTDDPNGDYIAAVNYRIYREYQGGPVMKVVENITIASMKNLFAGKK